MMLEVRTTVTIEPDIELLLRRAMKAKGLGFKEALNDALRRGLIRETPAGGRSPAPFRTFSMKLRADVNLDKALSLAADLEDEETARKMALGK